jgi:hypothetical protein
MGPQECHESVTDRIYEELQEEGLNPLDLFKEKTLRLLLAVCRRGERTWETINRKGYETFRKLLNKALDRKEEHDKRCKGDDGRCLEQTTKGFHRELDDYALKPTDLMTPDTLLALEKVTRIHGTPWEEEDRLNYRTFRRWIWAALENHAEEQNNCQEDDELMEKLAALRDRIQQGVS